MSFELFIGVLIGASLVSFVYVFTSTREDDITKDEKEFYNSIDYYPSKPKE